MAYTTINKPSNYFDTKLYTGTGSAQSITGLGFSPDFVWIKDRTSANNHRLLDIVRGATKELYSSTTDTETTQAQSLTTFNSNGFSIGTLSSINTNSNNYASWCWEANGAGVANTAGTISSTVSANTTSGFSIVSWTGTTGVATVGHGLGTTPAMIILKNRSVVSSWVVYNKSLGATRYLFLDLTSAQQTDSLAWNNTEPDSTKFTINSYTNGSGNNLIAYCFAEVKGFSKFGSYVGNANADGTFIYTGFKPAFILTKYISGEGINWNIKDTARERFNVTTQYLIPNLNIAEGGGSTWTMDILSNGFKIRTSDGLLNSSGTYIYAAFAEQPLVGTNNVPATAR